MKKIMGIAFLIVILVIIIFIFFKPRTYDLMIYCAGGLREPAMRLQKEFEKKEGISINMLYGNSGMLLSQLVTAKRGDIYFPGDAFYMKQAEEKGVVVSYVIAAYFVPVLAVKKGNNDIKKLEDLARPGLHIGLCEERAAMGRVSKKILEDRALWDKIIAANKHRYVAATVNEVANAIKSGSVDAGIIWDAVAYQYGGKTGDITVIRIPGVNEKVEIPVGLLNYSKKKALAKKFLDYAVSEEGRKIFKECYYQVPE